MKKRITMVIAVILVCLFISTEAAAKITYVKGGGTWTSGSITLHIKDVESGKTTTGILKVNRNNTIIVDDFLTKPFEWFCRLDIIGENNHNLKLNQNTVTTKVDDTNQYVVMNFSLSWIQHENYALTEVMLGGDYNKNRRFNFREYNVENTGDFTLSSQELTDNDLEKTVNLQMCASQLGIITNYENRYEGATCTLEYRRPSYTVTFLDDKGNVFEQQRVLRGDDAKRPVDPTKEGYYFGGWDKGFSNIKEDITITPKWVERGSESTPVSGDNPLSAHTDLYDETQTFYVPGIDTELINPKIE